VTAIRAADTDGNAETEADPDWLPLLTTPNFPTYTAAHGTASGTTSKLLELFYGTDVVAFTVGTEGFDVPDRTFNSFSEAGMEGATSRLYGGIHWSFDNDDGFRNGQALAAHIHSNFLRPVPEPCSAQILITAAICGTLIRRRKERQPV
jgi:hypothetical protein